MEMEEKTDGNVEPIDFSIVNSKKILISPTNEQFDILKKLLESRIIESGCETIYEIGIGDDEDNGLEPDEFAASVATLQSLAATLSADCVELRQRPSEKGMTGQYLIRKRVEETDFIEIRVAVVGNVDAGKSTLLGVLTHGELDNGRGHARQRLFRHKHEMESGRTSSVGNDILGFDSLGQVVNKPDKSGHGNLDWVNICQKSAKVITFIDLAGHERYLKTTVFGMTGYAPDFGMLMIAANSGMIGMTKEHLGLALALSVPVFVVVTKIDMCPPNILHENLKMICKVLKSSGVRKCPILVKCSDDVVLSATNFTSQRLCPIFQVSNVTGDNLDLLKLFLNLLNSNGMGKIDKLPAEFQIDDTYSVPGVGCVISGTCLQGIIRLNDTLLLGPDASGHFIPISIKSIHRKRMSVGFVKGKQTASFALKKIKRSQIRKGMVLVSPELNPQACWEFDGEIVVLHAMVHCGSIRQTASILNMSKETLRTGDKAVVRFRFIKHPEYLRPQQRLVFREGRTKAVGNVIEPITSTVSKPHLHQKPSKMHSRGQQNQNHSPNAQREVSMPLSSNECEPNTSNEDLIKDSAQVPMEGVIERGVDKRDMNHRIRMKRKT